MIGAQRKKKLLKTWGKRVRCLTGADQTARDNMGYIGRGQMKTPAAYDFAPSLSVSHIYKLTGTKNAAVLVCGRYSDGKVEQRVNAFFKELSEP